MNDTDLTWDNENRENKSNESLAVSNFSEGTHLAITSVSSSTKVVGSGRDLWINFRFYEKL